MINTSTFLRILRRSTVAGAVVAAAVVVGPATANKDPVTPEQLKVYQEVFMEEVRKGDLLFHGDAAMAEQLGVKLSTTGWACAMCHPHGLRYPPARVPEVPGVRWPSSRRCAT